MEGTCKLHLPPRCGKARIEDYGAAHRFQQLLDKQGGLLIQRHLTQGAKLVDSTTRGTSHLADLSRSNYLGLQQMLQYGVDYGVRTTRPEDGVAIQPG